MRIATVIVAAVCVSLLVHASVFGCSFMQWDPNDTVENPRFESPDKLHTLVIRLYVGLGDFETTTQGALAGMTPPFAIEEYEEESEFLPDDYDPYVPEDPLDVLAATSWSEPDEPEIDEPMPLEAALYRNTVADARELVATFMLEGPLNPSSLLVSEDGAFVVSWEIPDGFVVSSCGGSSSKPGIVIYDAARGMHRRVEFDDLLTASDVEWLRFGAFAEVTLRIRNMPNTGSQVLTVSFPPAEAWQGPVEVDVDLGTGARLQPVLDLYPTVREIVVETSAQRASNDGCEEGTAAEAIDSAELLARATHEPLPVYPEVAVRAGVTGTVVVEVVVGEDGAVSCARVLKGLPFGLDAAAVNAIRQWRFSTVDDVGHKAPFAGVLQVRFQINRPKTS